MPAVFASARALLFPAIVAVPLIFVVVVAVVAAVAPLPASRWSVSTILVAKFALGAAGIILDFVSFLAFFFV